MHYMLIYELAPDYQARRGQFRPAHLALAWQAVDRGEMVLAGAAGDPIEGAMLLFSGDSPQAASAFAQADPYVLNGIVKSWRVLPWHTVAGRQASNPTRGG